MRNSFNKIPFTLRITPLQYAALNSLRYGGKVSLIIRFLLDKLINGELPDEVITELEQHLKDAA